LGQEKRGEGKPTNLRTRLRKVRCKEGEAIKGLSLMGETQKGILVKSLYSKIKWSRGGGRRPNYGDPDRAEERRDASPIEPYTSEITEKKGSSRKEGLKGNLGCREIVAEGGK